MKRASRSSRIWFSRLGLTAVGFAAGMVLVECSLRPTRWSAREFYSSRGWLNPAYPQVVGQIQKNWAADFRKNSLSLRGAEPVHPSVIALGDSCTAGCFVRERETYAGLLQSRNVEVVNAGVPGYSSFQGLAWVRDSRVMDYRPKLVTIYYGWNDHWRAAFPESVFYRLRLAAPYSHLASWVLFKYEGSLNLNEKRFHYFPRVSLREYRSNLRELVRRARAVGAVVVLITAPIEPRMLPKPPDGRPRAPRGRFPDFMDHDAYVRATREVAAETGAGLVDFAAEYELRKTVNRDEFFEDFVHPNAKGHAVLAGMLRPWVECSQAHACPPHSSRAKK
ncbi:MAG: SGNH/GDSL hydrolase family protein [Elusimicrobiota bacterium]